MSRRPDVVFMRPVQGALRVECNVCKGAVDLPLPQSVDALVTTTDALVKAHRPCQERAAQAKRGEP